MIKVKISSPSNIAGSDVILNEGSTVSTLATKANLSLENSNFTRNGERLNSHSILQDGDIIIVSKNIVGN